MCGVGKDLPSFSPQRESRALSVPQRGNGNVQTPGVGNCAPSVATIMKIGVFILMRGPGKAIRNCDENRPFSSSYVALARPWQFSPQRESRALTMRRHGRGPNIRRVDGGIAPCAFPSAQPSLHPTRALDSRCDENDGAGLPDSHCGSINGSRLT